MDERPLKLANKYLSENEKPQCCDPDAGKRIKVRDYLTTDLMVIMPAVMIFAAMVGTIVYLVVKGASPFIGALTVVIAGAAIGLFIHLLYKVFYFHYGRDLLTTLLYDGPDAKEAEHFRKVG